MSNPHPLAVYLADCRAHRTTGAVTPETSLYGPLAAVLNAAGAGLKPTVRAFMNLKNQGGNMPDGGLFTWEQYSSDETETPVGQLPSRGAIECKKPKDDLAAIGDGIAQLGEVTSTSTMRPIGRTCRRPCGIHPRRLPSAVKADLYTWPK